MTNQNNETNGTTNDCGNVADMSAEFARVNKLLKKGLRTAIHVGNAAYGATERVVGKDRMLGMVALGGKGGAIGMLGGPKGVVAGSIICGGVGLIAGRAAKNWIYGADVEGSGFIMHGDPYDVSKDQGVTKMHHFRPSGRSPGLAR